MIGNISDNKWALQLYQRRFAFADAYFPGKGGLIITPSESIWDSRRNVLVIGVSGDDDIPAAFRAFTGLLENGAKTVGPLRRLETKAGFPKPPESVSSMLDHTRSALSPSGTTSWAVQSSALNKSRSGSAMVMAPYTIIANWGLSYHLSGDRKWAAHFLEGMRFLRERAEQTGQWIPEPWTNVYFCLWKMISAWELIDDDPLFTPEDRKLVDEVLWGYTRFCTWLPNLSSEMAPPDEPRQNHTTFLALSLANAHRYFTQKYGIAGLDSLAESARMAFDRGAASSFRPNDDAGSYLNLAPIHLLTYQMARNDLSYLKSPKMTALADLVAATIDNRNDPVGFGDVGGYTHRGKGYGRGTDASFFGMTSWATGDPRYQWLYNWSTGTGPNRGGELSFSLEEMYYGCYAVEGKESFPSHLTGVHPIFLDDGSLRWSALRSWKNGNIPRAGERYLDKLTFRPSFAPEDEYLLLDGTSTFSHGHYDGNTVTRLTWKDRIWLFETDYIKLTPRYHNGVVVTRDGVQDAPAPLTVLDYSADFKTVGYSGSTSRDFNGADWTRSILWKKGRYFLIVDRIRALREGTYRLEQRWRSRGDVTLAGNKFRARQGNVSFFIRSADDAPRSIVYDPDAFLSTWSYPYGNGKLAICDARRELPLARNGEYSFANLLYAAEDSLRVTRELFKAGENLYVIRDSGLEELAGFDPSVLAGVGVTSDCALFNIDSERLSLVNVTEMRAGNMLMEAPSPVHLQAEFRKNVGILEVPAGAGGTFRMRGMAIAGVKATKDGADTLAELIPGTYAITFAAPLPDLRPLVKRYSAMARTVKPSQQPAPLADFGFQGRETSASPDTIAAFYPDGADLLLGDCKGNILRFSGSRYTPVCRMESGRPIPVIHAADIDGDGKNEILAGDDKENLCCFGADGKLRWSQKMTRYYGADASATSIVTADLDGSGKIAILVATGGWRVYAFNPDGSIRWESFTFYHPETKIGFLKDTGGKSYVAVGTKYMTPLNVLSAKDGENLWYVWEEMGSEFIARTQYCGFCLTDMAFIDTDRDGKKEIVFGTKYNTVYALRAENGACVWEANVGDEVTALREIANHSTGEPEILVATEAGDLFRYDRSGRRIDSMGVGSAITDMLVIPAPSWKRNDIVLSTRDGRVVVCDDASFLVRASVTVGSEPLKGLALGGKTGNEENIRAVSDRGVSVLRYHPFNLRKMRTD